MTNVFNFSRKNRGNRDRKEKRIISMWPFNQYRVLKIKVTRNIYHKAPDVHIFHIIDEKKNKMRKGAGAGQSFTKATTQSLELV